MLLVTPTTTVTPTAKHERYQNGGLETPCPSPRDLDRGEPPGLEHAEEGDEDGDDAHETRALLVRGDDECGQAAAQGDGDVGRRVQPGEQGELPGDLRPVQVHEKGPVAPEG